MGEEHEDYLPTFEIPKRRVWPFIVGVLAVAAIAGFVMWRNATKPVPLRVLIAVDIDGYWWDDSKPAMTLAEELGDFLHDKGFEVVKAGQPGVDEILSKAKSPLEAARELRASYVISATIDPKVEKIPIQDGFYEVWLEASLDIFFTADDKPFFSTPLMVSEGARGRGVALNRLAELTSKVARAEVVPALMDHESVRDILTGHEPALIDQLQPAKNFVKTRKLQIDEKLAEYDQLATLRESGERGQSELTFSSDKRAEDQLVGERAKGVLRVASPVELFYDPTRGEVLRRLRLETLEWVKDTGEPEVIWRGYNAFTYPSLSNDGTTVVMVEDLYGFARSLTVIRDGKAKRIRVDHERALSEPRISPDGENVALVDRACRRCDEEIAVLSLDDAKEHMRITPKDYHRIGGFKWLDDAHLVVVAQPPLPPVPEPDPDAEEAPPAPEADPLAVYRVGLDGEWELLLDLGYRTYVDPVVSPDGKWLAVSDYRSRIVLLPLGGGEPRPIDVRGRAAALAFSPDSQRVVFEIEGLEGGAAEEIMLVDVASGTATRVTQNGWPDRYPVFSHDGKRILFEARNADPAFPKARTVSRIASVSVP